MFFIKKFDKTTNEALGKESFHIKEDADKAYRKLRKDYKLLYLSYYRNTEGKTFAKECKIPEEEHERNI